MNDWNDLKKRCLQNGAPLTSALQSERNKAAHASAETSAEYLALMLAEWTQCLNQLATDGLSSTWRKTEQLLALDTTPLVVDLPGGGSLTVLAMAPWHPLMLEAKAQQHPLQVGDVLCLAPHREFMFSHDHANGWSIWRPTRVDDWPVEAMCRRTFGEPLPPSNVLVGSAIECVNLVVPGGLEGWQQVLGSAVNVRAFVASRMMEAERDFVADASTCAEYMKQPPKADLTCLGGLSKTRLRLLPDSQPVGWTDEAKPGHWRRSFRPAREHLPLRSLANQLGAALCAGEVRSQALGLDVHVGGAGLALVHLARLHSKAVRIVDPLLPSMIPPHLLPRASTPDLLYMRERTSSYLNAAERRPGYNPRGDH